MNQKLFFSAFSEWSFCLFVLVLSSLSMTNAFGQCTINQTQYPSSALVAPVDNIQVTLEGCVYTSEYSVITNILSGNSYSFTLTLATSSNPNKYITIVQNGVILDHGISPVVVTALTSDDFQVYWNEDASCGQQQSCRYTTIQCISCVSPLNDDCTNATSLIMNGGAIIGTLTGATDSGVDFCLGDEDDDVWYTFVAPASGEINVNINRISGIHTAILFSVNENSCGTLQNVDCGSFNFPRVVGLDSGSIYFLQVYSGVSGSINFNFDISIEEYVPSNSPLNDDCSGAIVLINSSGISVNGNGVTNFSNALATPSSQPSLICGGSQWIADDDLWYEINVPVIGSFLVIDVDGGPSYDPVIEVYEGSCQTLNPIGCLNSVQSQGSFESFGIQNTMAPTYFARVYDAGNNNTGSFVINAYIINPLPVELMNFKATHQNLGNSISWSTSSEVNNDHFILEYAFESPDAFSKLSLIQGKGTTSKDSFYSYFHNTSQAGTHYYRLKQVDFDGTASLSNVVAITQRENSELSIYPNPAEQTLTLRGVSEGEHFVLSDALGRVVLSGRYEGHELAIGQLPAGTYVVQVEQSDVAQRFVKL